MSPERETDQHTGTETTGHEWDGIKELDTPLPRWWLWIFYACIAFSIGYWVLMPAWPGLTGYTPGLLHDSARAQVAVDLAALKARRSAQATRLAGASLEQIEKDPQLQAYALAVGQSIFGDNCATCHSAGGVGAKGYANLRDDVWLWGGSLEDIQRTITHGVRSDDPDARSSQMPAFGRDAIVSPTDVDDLTEYVVALSGRPANPVAAARARPVFAAQCVACHGPAGAGDVRFGAPDRTDRAWL
jgi:cytochrome c oxidase cbb3-type subunit 3